MPNPPPPKYKIREQLNADVKAFLRDGGKITEINPGKSNVKPTRYGAGDLLLNPEKQKIKP